MKKARVASKVMEQIDETEFCRNSQGTLSRAEHVPIVIKRGDKRLAVLVPAALHDLYTLYEDVYWDSYASDPNERIHPLNRSDDAPSLSRFDEGP